MTRVRRESLAEQAAGLLIDRISDGEWEVGGKLPSETALAPQLGVGRSTAREAIRILAGRGILITRQGAGVFLAATDDLESWNSRLRAADIVAVIEARTAIEVEAATLAAERRTSTDLQHIQAAVDLRGRNRIGIDEHVATDLSFHRSVVAAAHSPVLLDVFDDLTPRSRQAMIEMLTLRGHHGDEADQDIHRRMFDAIALGDLAAASQVTRAHLLQLASQMH